MVGVGRGDGVVGVQSVTGRGVGGDLGNILFNLLDGDQLTNIRWVGVAASRPSRYRRAPPLKPAISVRSSLALRRGGTLVVESFPVFETC